MNILSTNPPNARHHPPAAACDDESRALRGRVHAVVKCGVELEIRFGQTSHLHQVPEQPGFKGLIPVNRDGQPDIAPRSTADMVAPLHAKQRPAMPLKDFGELLAGDRPHTAISRMRSLSET